VFADCDAGEEGGSLVLGHTAVRDRSVDPGLGVRETDLLNLGIEIAGLGRGAQPKRLLVSHASCRDHLVESRQQPLASHRSHVDVSSLVHDSVLSIQSVSVKTYCRIAVVMYAVTVPKLWTETIEEHRREVRDSVLATTAALVAEHGLLSVTMSRIAEETGIGRATLYKYFPDVESILSAWHERHVADHFTLLAAVNDQPREPAQRLEAVLEAYALVTHESRAHGDIELAARLHHGEHVAQAHHRLRHMLLDLITSAVVNGDVRNDIAPDELVTYCLHALTAANTLPSKAAVHRLVAVTLAGLCAQP
jgi:AcrR family transcriptional regulator